MQEVNTPTKEVNNKGFTLYYSLGLFPGKSRQPKRAREAFLKFSGKEKFILPLYALEGDQLSEVKSRLLKGIEELFASLVSPSK
jgi:hypothetical protein